MPAKKRLSVDNRQPHGATHRSAVDWEALLARIPGGKTVVRDEAHTQILRQGSPADAVFYIRGGEVKLSVTSEEGREAIIAFLDADEFFGEGSHTRSAGAVLTDRRLSEAIEIRAERRGVS